MPSNRASPFQVPSQRYPSRLSTMALMVFCGSPSSVVQKVFRYFLLSSDGARSRFVLGALGDEEMAREVKERKHPTSSQAIRIERHSRPPLTPALARRVKLPSSRISA